jgi:hypothetical protein
LAELVMRISSSVLLHSVARGSSPAATAPRASTAAAHARGKEMSIDAPPRADGWRVVGTTVGATNTG